MKILIEKVLETYGRMDFAFNNAGIEGKRASTIDCTKENWEYVINYNLRGVWLCMKHEIPHMTRHGGGAIVNMSTAFGLIGIQCLPAYVASKHGVIGLIKAAALEFAQEDIRAKAGFLGGIRTPMQDRLISVDPQIEAQIIAQYPIGHREFHKKLRKLFFGCAQIPLP